MDSSGSSFQLTSSSSVFGLPAGGPPRESSSGASSDAKARKPRNTAIKKAFSLTNRSPRVSSDTSSPPPLVDMSHVQVVDPQGESVPMDVHHQTFMDQRSIHVTQGVDPQVVSQYAASAASAEHRAQATEAVAQARENALQTAAATAVDAAQAVACARIETTNAQASAEAQRSGFVAELNSQRASFMAEL